MKDTIKIELEKSKTGLIHYARVFVNDVPFIGTLIVDSEAYGIVKEWLQTETNAEIEIIEVN